MAEKIELELSADISGAKRGLHEFRDDLEAFNKRLKDDKAIKLSVDAANVKIKLDEVRQQIKELGEWDSKVALTAEMIRLQKELTSANRALTNYVRTGDEGVSVLWKLFASVNDEIRQSREEVSKLGRDTSKLDGLARKAEEIKRSFDAGQISASKYQTELGKISTKAQTATEALKNQGSALDSLKSRFSGLAAGAAAYFSASKIVEISDSYRSMTNALKQVAGEDEVPALLARIGKAANDSRTPVAEYAQSFFRFYSVMKEIGGTKEETFTMLDTLSKGLTASGRSAAETSSVMLQLSQAFGSGKLAGDEFRSVSEAMPWLLDILAKSMGVPRWQLKELAADGKITSEILKDALITANKDINAAFDRSSDTIGQSITKVSNSLTLAFGKFDETSGFSASVIKMIEGVGKFGETVFDVMGKIVPSVSSGFADVLESVKSAFSSIAEGWGIVADFVSSKTQESNEISVASWEFFGRAVGAILSILAQGFRGIVAITKSAGIILGNFFGASVESIGDFGKVLIGVFEIIPESVARAFVGLGQIVAVWVAKAANEAIGAINGLIELVNKVPGVSIGKLGEVGFAKGFSANVFIPKDSIDKITAGASQIGAKFTAAFEWTGDEVGDIMLDMVAQSQTAFDKINDLRKKADDDAKSVVKTSAEDVKKKLADLGKGSGKKDKEAEKAEKEAKKLREELDKADADSWDRMRKRWEDGYEELTKANEKNYSDVAKLSDAYSNLSSEIEKTSADGSEEIRKIGDEIDAIGTKIKDLTGKKTEDLGARFLEIGKELKQANEDMQDPFKAAKGEQPEIMARIEALKAEKLLIEANTTENERKESIRLASRSKTQEILDAFEAEKAKLEQDKTAAETRRTIKQSDIEQDIANLKTKQDAIALAIANENAMIIAQDDERRRTEKEFTKFFGKQIEGRSDMLASLIEKAKEARVALESAGISSSVPTDGTATSEKGKTAYISVTNNQNVDAESFLRNLDNLVK